MVLKFIDRDMLVELKTTMDNQDILLAVSGGVDSILLLDMLCELWERNTIHVVHFNHGLRKESDKEFREVKEICSRYGAKVEFHGIELNVKAYMEVNKVSMETGARNLRYSWFKRLCENLNINHVLLGHHGDDLSETVIMRMVNGALSKGLIGMQFSNEIDNITYLRPLIKKTKEEIYAEATKRNLIWFEDITNSDETILRNNIRKNIIPELKKINSKLIDSIYKISNERKEIEDFFDDVVENIEYTNLLSMADEVTDIDNLAMYGYDKNFFMKQKPILRKRMLKSILDKVVGSKYIYNQANLDEAIMSFISKNISSNFLEIESHLILVSDYDKFWLLSKKDYLILLNNYHNKVDNNVEYFPITDVKNQRLNDKRLIKIFNECKVPPAFRQGYLKMIDGSIYALYDFLGREVMKTTKGNLKAL